MKLEELEQKIFEIDDEEWNYSTDTFEEFRKLQKERKIELIQQAKTEWKKEQQKIYLNKIREFASNNSNFVYLTVIEDIILNAPEPE